LEIAESVRALRTQTKAGYIPAMNVLVNSCTVEAFVAFKKFCPRDFIRELGVVWRSALY
jgi:hypothetical protein